MGVRYANNNIEFTFVNTSVEILSSSKMIQIHGIGPSPPCRIVYMTCEVLGLGYEMINCDLQKGENKTPEYLKV